jgi:hypothetical protein
MIIQNTRKWEVGRAEYQMSMRTELDVSYTFTLGGKSSHDGREELGLVSHPVY